MTIETEDCQLKDNYLGMKASLVKSICILPCNYAVDDPSKYYYESTLPTVLKLAEKGNLPLKVLGKENDFKLIQLRGINWISPTLIIGALYYSQNPAAVNLALNLLSNYLYGIFKGIKDSGVTLTILVTDEKSLRTKKLTYDGPVEGLSEVRKMIENISSELLGKK